MPCSPSPTLKGPNLAVFYSKDVPIFHPAADVQGPQCSKDDVAKHFLAVASSKQ